MCSREVHSSGDIIYGVAHASSKSANVETLLICKHIKKIDESNTVYWKVEELFMVDKSGGDLPGRCWHRPDVRLLHRSCEIREYRLETSLGRPAANCIPAAMERASRTSQLQARLCGFRFPARLPTDF